MRIAVCEDTETDAQALFSVLEQYALARPGANCSIFAFPSAQSLLAAGETFDCYILDILMQGRSGIELARGSELRVSFEASVAALIENGCFLRPHRSYLVNAVHVVSLTSQTVTLSSGAVIPVTRMRSAATKARYLEYMARAQRSP